jgi:DNA polymerase-3 subunit alpha
MMPAVFLPLRTQTCFSMLDSTIEPKALAKACARLGYPAVALTDRGNLFAAMAFSKACLDAGVQPILGVLLPLVRPVPGGSLRPGQAAPVDHLPLLVQGAAGWRHLLALVSDCHLKGESGPDALTGRTDGLIALTGGADGAVARLLAEGQETEAEAYLARLESLFGDRLFVEIARTDDPVEVAAEPGLLALAHARGLPIVGTNIARFLEPDGWEAHDIMRCIATGQYVDSEGRERSNPRHYLADPMAMADRFQDLPEALANAALVARRSAFALRKREPVLPKLVADPAAEKAELKRLAEAGLDWRLTATTVADRAPYTERLAFELDVIGGMGFAGYFLIVADFIQWAKAEGIPVGPGRGSGAGSVVAWALSITDLDPLEFGLLFERFLNPERKSMPDFDIDFCETRREEVIRYVQRKYGADRVAQIITFGTLKARAVVKDVGRVMQLPYGQVNRLSTLIPANPADPWDLERALAGVPELTGEMEADPRVAQLLGIARQLEGRPRHASTHAAGVVIGDRPLAELVPLYRDPRSDMPVSQFDLKWAEEAGLVKFDFLGLKTLSVLARAKALLAARGITIDLDRLPFDDPAVFQLMTRGDTVGVFQFESEGMRRALALVKPDRFEDIIALGALYRPGPMDNIPSFAARKHGREAVDYLHPSLEPILKPTYGVIIYQEQVMQIAQVLAGYSLGEADLLRRAMGKKIKAEMDAQKARFVDGAVANGVPAARADFIFNLVEKFAGYGFNKSHAAAYALVAWQTAWLKTHHPAAFFAASMAFDIGQTDKLAVLVDDMRRLGVPLLSPCLNRSGADFTLEEADGVLGVRYALGALKGVGEAAMAAIVAERDVNGPFRSLDDLAQRIDPRALNRRQIEALAGAGAFDGFGLDRAQVVAGADHLLAAASRAQTQRETGQGGLFGRDTAAEAVHLPAAEPWSRGACLAQERAAFGFWFAGHPVEAQRAVTAQYPIRLGAELAAAEGRVGEVRQEFAAVIVEDAAWRTPQGKGPDKRYLMVDLSDPSGSFGVRCFEPELYPLIEAVRKSGDPVLVRIELGWREGDSVPGLRLRHAERLAALADKARVQLTVTLAPGHQPGLGEALAAALPRGGRSTVDIRVPLADGHVARLLLGTDFALPPDIDFILSRLAGVAGSHVEPLKPQLRLVA